MSSFETLSVSRDARDVVNVILNRPEKRNALNVQMIAELTEIAAAQHGPDAGRVMVLQGAGDVFCAGGDLSWMAEQFHASREERLAQARQLALMFDALYRLPVPLIGKFHGGAFGGGVGLACLCDVGFATPQTRFGLTETRLGLIPATISPYVQAKLGLSGARRLFFTGRIFDAKVSQEIGIVSQVCEPGQIDDAIDAEISACLKTAPEAVKRAKNLTTQLGPVIDEAVIETSIAALADCWEDPQTQSRIAAFLNKT